MTFPGISGFRMADFKLTSYLKLTSASYWPTTLPPRAIVECHIVDQWDMEKERKKMTQSLRNQAHIKQPVHESMKWYFQASVGHISLLINQCPTNGCTVYRKYSYVRQKILKPRHLCTHFFHCISLFVNSVSLVFLVFLQFCWIFFTIEMEKPFTLLWIRLGVTGIPLDVDAGLFQHIRRSSLWHSWCWEGSWLICIYIYNQP